MQALHHRYMYIWLNIHIDGAVLVCFQWFDTVGWVAGRASSLKKMGVWWRWALITPDGGAPSRMVSASASVNLPLRYKVQTFSSGTGSPGWSRKKGRKMVVVEWWCSACTVHACGG